MQYEQVLSDAALRARFLKIFIKAVGYVPTLTDVETVSKCLHILTAVLMGCRVRDSVIETYLTDGKIRITLWYKETLSKTILTHSVMTCSDEEYDEEYAKFSLQFYLLDCDLTSYIFTDTADFSNSLLDFDDTLFLIEGLQLHQYISGYHGVAVDLNMLTTDAKNILFEYALLQSSKLNIRHTDIVVGLANLPSTSNLRLKIARAGKMSFIGPKDKKI